MNTTKTEKKIAVVYDWIDKWGGVERVLLTLYSMFPRADFYSSYADYQSAPWAKKINIHTSFIQKLPRFIRKNRILSFILYPFAFESLDLSRYNLVISVTSSFAKAVITKPQTVHLCYLLTPMRYLWLYPETYLNALVRFLAGPLLRYTRFFDRIASKRPDHIISLSKEVKNRCRKYYEIDSEVIYPPFDVDYWMQIKKSMPSYKTFLTDKLHLSDNESFFLVVARLEQYKKVDCVIKAFSQSARRLIVVGKGTQLSKLKQISGPRIIFIQDITDQELAMLYSRAQALIMPQVEDFGYVAVEAQFFGCPVIAYAGGGSLETVIEGKTGLFIHKQSAQEIASVLERWDKISYNLRHSTEKYGVAQAMLFSKHIFMKQIHEIINFSFSSNQ